MINIDVDRELPQEHYALIEKYNHKLRQSLVQNLQTIKDPREKIISLREFFAKDFDYDYEALFTPHGMEWREFVIDGQRYQSQSIQIPNALPPALYLTKVGRCGIFSDEVDHMFYENDINYRCMNKASPCLNIYKRELTNIGHRYSQAEIEINKKTKQINVDICALIFERDAKAQNIDIDYSKFKEFNTQF